MLELRFKIGIFVNATAIFCLVSVPAWVFHPLLSPCHLLRCAQTAPPTLRPCLCPPPSSRSSCSQGLAGITLIPLWHKFSISSLGFSFFPWNPGVPLESRRLLLPRTLASLESSFSSASPHMLGCARSPWKQQEFHLLSPKILGTFVKPSGLTISVISSNATSV